MTQNDVELLRLYAERQSEEAFSELVRRHINVVYAAALRQVEGDASLAEDVTQRVFSDLAGKASTLTNHTSLVGWLFSSTRFCALTARRSEQRRRTREQEAYMMEQVHEPRSPAPDWDRLSNVLDETMNELGETDREAILLRFFEGRSLAETGAGLGVSDNAARMRVDRALDKLRGLLSSRGVSSTAAALAVLFDSYGAPPAPVKLAARVAKQAVKGGAAAVATGFWAARHGVKIALGLAAVIALLVAVPVFFSSSQKKAGTAVPVKTNDPVKGEVAPPPVIAPGESAAKPKVAAAIESAMEGGLKLILKLTDGRTGKPVAGVRVEFLSWTGSKSNGRKEFSGDDEGICEVTYAPTTTRVLMGTQRERYADTRIEFTTAGREKIPGEFTVRLDGAAWIGGMVLDPENQPVAGARVGWNHAPAPQGEKPPVTHQFNYMEVVTGADGHWQMNRIGEDLIDRIYGYARHADYTASSVYMCNSSEDVRRLRDGTAVFYLGRSLAIGGDVKDAKGRAIEGAEVLVGRVGSPDRRVGKGLSDGTFLVKGCKPGAEVLTATAPGFASSIMAIEVGSNAPPYHMVLSPGRVLRLRVVDPAGKPVAKAEVALDIETPRANGELPLPQTMFMDQTGEDGGMTWLHAPEGELRFRIKADHYMSSGFTAVPADEQEHLVTLRPAVVVKGVVRDEGTGKVITDFRMLTGAPWREGKEGKRYQLDWQYFSKGEYEYMFDYARQPQGPSLGYYLKFEADGYEEAESRLIGPEEGTVRLDMVLKRAPVTVVTVFSPQGQALPAAEVDFIKFQAHTRKGIGQLDTLATLGGFSVVTDAKGQFTLPKDDRISQVIVSCAEGFGSFSPQELKAAPSLPLVPWGRIEATCLSNGRGVPDRVYLLQLGTNWANSGGDLEINKYQSDAAGHFTIARAPPGKRLLTSLISQGGPNETPRWIHATRTEVEVRPGETTKIVFGDEGHTVSGHIQWPDGGRPPGWWLSVDLATPWPAAPPTAEERKDPELMAKYFNRPEIKTARAAQRRYVGVPSADGRFAFDAVTAGQYELKVAAYKPEENRRQMTTLQPKAVLPVTIPESPATGYVDVGEIVLQPGEP